MPSDIFRFKKFAISQGQTAMKVGTDGVLLGAWANAIEPGKILDIGTGTGLIALMMAQRFPGAKITGVEINADACNQAKENVVNSIFSNQIEILHLDILEWKSPFRFDSIVCNPPFYLNWHQAKNESRSIARHGNPNQLLGWLEKFNELLTADGVINLILPTTYFDWIEDNVNHLHINRICWVRPNPVKPSHRILIEFSKTKRTLIKEELIIEQNERHHYSDSYVNLCKDFYLNF